MVLGSHSITLRSKDTPPSTHTHTITYGCFCLSLTVAVLLSIHGWLVPGQPPSPANTDICRCTSSLYIIYAHIVTHIKSSLEGGRYEMMNTLYCLRNLYKGGKAHANSIQTQFTSNIWSLHLLEFTNVEAIDKEGHMYLYPHAITCALWLGSVSGNPQW